MLRVLALSVLMLRVEMLNVIMLRVIRLSLIAPAIVLGIKPKLSQSSSLCTVSMIFARIDSCLAKPGNNTKGGYITVVLTSCLTGLESAV